MLKDWDPYLKETAGKLEPDPKTRDMVLGVVPHAGWIYSGKLAASVLFKAKEIFGEKGPEQIVILGGHLPEAYPVISYPEELWETPISPLNLSPKMNESLEASSPNLPMKLWSGKTNDNTIEVELPLIKLFFPNSTSLALRVAPDYSAIILARALISLFKDKTTLFIASSDLTHYGEAYGFAPAGSGEKGLRYREANDRAFIEASLNLDTGGLIKHANREHSACSAGAVATITQIAADIGARGRLLDYYASSDISSNSSLSVGYAGMLFF
jgi:AmmeMemoRadiSam system protein B